VVVDIAPVRVIDPSAVEVDGVYVVGEFLGFRPRKARTLYEGTAREMTVQNIDVGIRMDGGVVEAVQFGSQEYATEAMAGAEIGDRVAVRVEVKHGVSNGRPWLFYTGARSGSSEAFAGEFGQI
jgi:hypothetical protein